MNSELQLQAIKTNLCKVVEVAPTAQITPIELEKEEEFMEAGKEELEVFEMLTYPDNAFDPVTGEKNKRDAMKDKLFRYKNIMTQKTRS